MANQPFEEFTQAIGGVIGRHADTCGLDHDQHRLLADTRGHQELHGDDQLDEHQLDEGKGEPQRLLPRVNELKIAKHGGEG
jgi:hypothetical protein